VQGSTSHNLVVDASVAVKWVVAEEHSDAAARLLDPDFTLSAPAHWLAEAATGLWAACRRGELSEQQANERTQLLIGAPVAVIQLEGLVTAAMALSLRLHLTVYDTLYIALAEQQAAILVTADRRLMQAVRRDKQLRDKAQWIGDR
jgi:predicted nucleic acid-binding protein